MLAQIDLEQVQNIGLPQFVLRGGRTTGVGGLFTIILPYVFIAAGIALLIYLIVGGLQLMTSRGDPKAVQGAQTRITNALIGFAIVILAYFIVQLFGQIFGLGTTPYGSIFGVN